MAVKETTCPHGVEILYLCLLIFNIYFQIFALHRYDDFQTGDCGGKIGGGFGENEIGAARSEVFTMGKIYNPS